jgi:phosphoglucosamine mutase
VSLPLTTERLFGTDGIRAEAGAPPLDRETVVALGWSLGEQLAQGSGSPPTVVLGGDTRKSTPEIWQWLDAGLSRGGARTLLAGVIPTPGIAYLVRTLGHATAISVSASHNPFPDNGIKLLDGQGFKWTEAAEEILEQRLRVRRAAGIQDGEDLGVELAIDPSLRERYLRYLVSTIHRGNPKPLGGLTVVADTGNGAASSYAGELFAELGANVIIENCVPNGININAGSGSTAPAAMAAAVVRHGAHLGTAFDGDADRCILADERGTVRDGDAILYLWATSLARQGLLVPKRIVATSMSNLGLERALSRHGIEVVRCGVGDRVVVDTMRREGIQLGGEQSGHIVELALSSTGDGLLTAIQMAAIVRHAGVSLSELLAAFERFPQVLLSVRVGRKVDFAELPAVHGLAQSIVARLGDEGRLVLRYSGTEPLARVMIEGPDSTTIQAMAEELTAALAAALPLADATAGSAH